MAPNKTQIKIDSIIKKCTYIEGQLKKYDDFFASNTDFHELESRITNCEELYTQYCRNHDELLEITDYCENFIEDRDRFEGQFEKWINFRDTFKSMIHNHAFLSDIQRLHYLLGCLEGDAKKLIEKIEISDDGYKQAWDCLNERYNNSRTIVEQHITEIFNLKSMSSETASEIRRLVDDMNNHLRGLKALDQPIQHWDMIIVNIISSKLDKETRKEWEMSNSTNEFPTWQKMVEFLNNKARTLSSIEIRAQTQNTTENRNHYIKSKNHIHNAKSSSSKTFYTQSNISNMSCNICKCNSHYTSQCKIFLDLSLDERLNKVRSLQLCVNCLRIGHKTIDCRAYTCKICRKRHHSLLHNPAYFNSNNNISTVSKNNDNTENALHNNITTSNKLTGSQSINTNSENNEVVQATSMACCSSSSKQVLLCTAIILIEDVVGTQHECRILLDSGSQSNFVSESFAQILCLKKERILMSVSGLNEASVNVKYKVSANIASRISSYKTKIDLFIVPKITNLVPSNHININNFGISKGISLADPKFYEPTKLDALIGAELFLQILKDGRIKLQNNLTLQNTELGYIISGKINDISELKISQNTQNFFLTSNEELNLQLKKFWHIESFNNKKILSEEEKFCESHFIKTHSRDHDGRYVVEIPLKSNVTQLGDSRDIALKRFFYLERKFDNNNEVKLQYVQFINDYKSQNHMKLVEAPINNSEITYYMPHHCVIKPSSSTTRLRVVFDASSKSQSGISFNDVQMIGAINQDELFSIILRFRKHHIAFTADVKQMYRQINVKQDQHKLQRILWRENTDMPIETYEPSTVTYGTASAPFLATRVLEQIAIDEGEYFSEAKKAIKDFYMDDAITGANTIENAIKLKDQLVKMLCKGKMILRKFASNSKVLLNTIPEQDRELKVDGNSCNELIKTLGLIWNPEMDIFIFKPHEFKKTKIISKRYILSEVSKIFDPLGLIAPILIQIKTLLQGLWQKQLDWDEPVSAFEQQIWENFQNEFESVHSFELNRCIIPAGTIYIEFHGFADASEIAYGACVYVRCRNKSNDITTHLVCSKSRVAPIKKLTIPRLELCAAHLLAQLIQKVTTSMKLNSQSTYLWSDSTIVLAWIKTPANQLKPFVNSRVSDIQEITSSMNWRHITSNQNPADIISRGMKSHDLKNCNLWWHGPDNLKTQTEFPNTNYNIVKEIPELKTITFITQNNELTDYIARFSSYMKLIKVTAYILRLRLPNNERPNNLVLSTEEIRKSILLLVKLIQAQSFQEEFKQLKKNTAVYNNSKLKTLYPILGNQDIIRVGGRIKNAHLTYGQKHQIIIPYKHHFTTLLFRYEHINNFHCGSQALLSKVRQQFWPVHGKSLSKLITKECVICFKYRPKVQSQIMGNYPAERITPARPFSTVGVDYCGPFMTKNQSSRTTSYYKSYIAVFICFSTKAVHLEVVSDMTSDAFIATLKRFISRRGIPTTIHSDNGTNFTGAHNELLRILNFFKSQDIYNQIKDFCTVKGIDWKFIPPRSPHFGGLWEAGVKSLKHHFKRITQNQHFNFEELNTITTQIESFMNSRPLTILSDDPNDIQPLTPGHFLIGTALNAIPEPTIIHYNIGRLTKWKKLQHIVQSLWKRWSADYIIHLQQRYKWPYDKQNIKLNTIVIIQDDQLPPNMWMLGRVIAVHSGDDDKIRVVSLKTKAGILRRAVTKICPLPIEDNSIHQPTTSQSEMANA